MQFSPRVVVWEREPDGMQHIVGDAQHALTPDDVTVNASIVTFVRYMREIPNGDYRFIDRNLEIAHRRMTIPGSPAERSELSYWAAHNPKESAAQMTRLVLDKNPAPIVTRQGDSLTWQITWAEQVRDSRGNLHPPLLYSGSITMAHEPTLSSDRAFATENSGGIDIWSYVLPESD
jgi:type IV secretory pathway TrbF-like protein